MNIEKRLDLLGIEYIELSADLLLITCSDGQRVVFGRNCDFGDLITRYVDYELGLEHSKYYYDKDRNTV